MGRISIISAKDNSLYIHGEAVLSLLISSAIEMEFSLFKKKRIHTYQSFWTKQWITSYEHGW